jgi:hypothetical protein
MINSADLASGRTVIDLYVLDAGQIEILVWSQYDPPAAPNTRQVVADPAFSRGSSIRNRAVGYGTR